MAASNYPPSEKPLTITHGKDMTWRLWLKWKLGCRLTKLEINFEWLRQKLGLELTSDERGIVARWITRNVKTSIRETLDEMEK